VGSHKHIYQNHVRASPWGFYVAVLRTPLPERSGILSSSWDADGKQHIVQRTLFQAALLVCVFPAHLRICLLVLGRPESTLAESFIQDIISRLCEAALIFSLTSGTRSFDAIKEVVCEVTNGTMALDLAVMVTLGIPIPRRGTSGC